MKCSNCGHKIEKERLEIYLSDVANQLARQKIDIAFDEILDKLFPKDKK